jgi:hypothetical protein
MSVVLLVVGLLITAAGFVTIGFGIPINAFSLGNTLIISGTVAVCSGLILIALSMAVRQLKRIAEALRSQAAMPKAVRPVAAEAPAGEGLVPPTAKLTPVAARQAAAPVPSFAPPPPRAQEPAPMPAAPTPSAPRPAEHRMSEHRVAAPPAEEEKGPLQWLRKKPSAPAAPAPNVNEPSMLDVPDEAPLSPRPPRLPFTTPPMAAEPAFEPKIEQRAEPRTWTPPGRDAGELKPVSRNEQIPRVAPQQAEPAKDKMFDVVWPDGRHTPPPVVPEPGAKREAKVDMPPPPPMPAARHEEPVADKQSDELPLPPANERTPAVLKSGVIDGMAYTLYADGSIEADLPTGIVKFASVDALRAHLEKQI